MHRVSCVAVVFLCTPVLLGQPAPHAYTRWKFNPAPGTDCFPIAVWLQSPGNAARYKAAGINLYVGLWRGPTESQLAELRKAEMPVICHQNDVGLAHKDDPIIAGWMHGDEPDNAQAKRDRSGYGPPIPPATIVADYEQIRGRDRARPVLLNLGQGVAWDAWVGRGVRTNHPEDYPEYVQGADIVSFDIYPVVHRSPQVAGKLEFVARGVSRLREWSRGEKIVWNCIECTRIQSKTAKPTPHQVRSEVWMALVHGSRGLIYFVHEWEPTFNEKALLDDPEMLRAVTAINREVQALAPVLNAPTASAPAAVTSSEAQVPIAALTKMHDGQTYVFTVCMGNAATEATVKLTTPQVGRAEVLGEARTIDVSNGSFHDHFEGYGVHLYRIR